MLLITCGGAAAACRLGGSTQPACLPAPQRPAALAKPPSPPPKLRPAPHVAECFGVAFAYLLAHSAQLGGVADLLEHHVRVGPGAAVLGLERRAAVRGEQAGADHGVALVPLVGQLLALGGRLARACGRGARRGGPTSRCMLVRSQPQAPGRHLRPAGLPGVEYCCLAVHAARTFVLHRETRPQQLLQGRGGWVAGVNSWEVISTEGEPEGVTLSAASCQLAGRPGRKNPWRQKWGDHSLKR